jgi:hypothetical protein
MKINLDTKQIRKFGFALATLLLVISSWKYYRAQTTSSYIFLIAGAVSFASAIFFQPVIKPIYIVMMKAAHILGWINTRILLGVIFYLTITPIGLIMRVFGKDILDKKIEPEKEDYWVKRDKATFDKHRYENQY